MNLPKKEESLFFCHGTYIPLKQELNKEVGTDLWRKYSDLQQDSSQSPQEAALTNKDGIYTLFGQQTDATFTP